MNVIVNDVPEPVIEVPKIEDQPAPAPVKREVIELHKPVIVKKKDNTVIILLVIAIIIAIGIYMYTNYKNNNE